MTTDAERLLQKARGGDAATFGRLLEVYGRYLGKHPDGKMFHDPLAACCAIDEGIGTWAEVELFREKGERGSRLCPGSGTWIITSHDHQRFLPTLLAC
jgi:inosine-uridine nucleoside N-ribohydrolase